MAKQATKKKRRVKRPKIEGVAHTFSVREDLDTDFSIIAYSLYPSDFTKRLNTLIAEDILKHKDQLQAFKNKPKK